MALPVTGWRSRRRFRRRARSDAKPFPSFSSEATKPYPSAEHAASASKASAFEGLSTSGARACRLAPSDMRADACAAQAGASVVVGKQRRVSGTRKRGSPRTERRRETNRRWRRARKTTTRAEDSRHVLARRLRPPRARPACPSAALASTPGPARASRDGTPSPSASRARRSPVRRGRLHARTRARLARRDASLRASSQRLPHPRQGVVRTRRGRRRA